MQGRPLARFPSDFHFSLSTFTSAGTDGALKSYADNRHGYMTLEVSAATLKGDFYTVPHPQEAWGNPADHHDSFTLDLKSHRVS